MTEIKMTTFLMIVFVAAVTVGGAILGWLVRGQMHGFSNEVELFDRGEVGGPKNGD